MRVLIWILLIFALAVGFTLAGKFDPGYAVLVYPPYRIELSLTLFVIVLLGLLFISNMFARLANATLSLPKQVRAFRQHQREQQAQDALTAAITHFLEQRYPQAEVAAQRAMELDASIHLAALIAARAVDAQQIDGGRARYPSPAGQPTTGEMKP